MISFEAKAALVELGRQLQTLRLARNDRQADFAARLGVSIPTLRKLEQGDPAVAIGTWMDAIWLLGRLAEVEKILAPSQSLFDRWETQQRQPRARKRASKK